MRALVWRASIAAVGLASAACAQGMDGNTLDTAARSGALASRRASAGAEHTIVVRDRDDGPRLPRPALSCAIDRRPEWFSPPGLNAELAHTTRVLLDLGLPDPRGLPLVTARAYPGRFDGVERATSMVGWLVAARDRSPAMLLALRGDLVEIEAEPSPLARIERSSIEPSDSWTAMQQHRAEGIVRHNYVSAALLALSGDVREANALWARLWPRGQSKSRAAVREFAELYFDSALGGFHAGRSAAPQAMTRALECARPHIEQNAEELTTTTVEGGAQRVTAERATAFLSAVPTLVDELRRRAAEPRATLTEAQLATAPIAALIAQLDGVALRFDGWTLSFEGEPLLVALRARGAAAAPEIIDAFERDGRWTRTIQHGSDPLRRSVVSVRALLAWLVTEHTGMRPEEFGWTSFSDPRDARPSEVAQTLRERWSALRNLAPFDRAVAALTDTNANFVRQIASVAWLFRPRPGEPSTPVLLRGSGPRVIDRFAVEGPALTEAQRERLAQTLLLRAPGLGPLRDASPVALAEEDRRCAYAQASYLVSPTRSLTFVQQTLERAYAREPNAVSPSCAAWLSAALVANGDRAAAEEVARRVRTLPWREAAITRVAHWWGALANNADALVVWEALAPNIAAVDSFRVRTAPGREETLVEPSLLSVIDARLLRARPLREAVLRLLDDARTHALIRFAQGSTEAQYLNPRGAHTLTFERAAEGADFVAAETIERLRLSDAVAHYLVDARALEAQPSFDLRWTRERRDRAIETIRAQLRAAPSQPVRSAPPSPHRRGAATTVH